MVIGSRGLPGLAARAPVGMVRWQEHVTVTRNRPTRVRVSLQRNIPVTMLHVVSQTVAHLSLARPQVPWDWIMFFKIIHNKEKFNVYSEFFFSHLFWIKSLCVIWKFFCAQTVYYILKDKHVHVYKVRHQTSKKVHVVDNGHKSVFQT